MRAVSEEIVEIQVDAPAELVEQLRSALEREEEYPKEQDLLS